ncbi:MAG: hypothetical protein WBL07_03770, partial [Thiothrix litoralis]|uniref:hypothetical protein n=1 Tax=Thiothrix litoralis TaxID=2891210 RepID=UPI003C72EF88
PDVDLKMPEVALPNMGLKAPAIDFDSIDPHKPILDLPDMDRELPDVELKAPEVALPNMGLKAPTIDFDSIDPHKPILDLPDMDRELPDVDLKMPEVALPNMGLKAPAIDFDSIDPHKPILDLPDMERELPDVDLKMPEVALPNMGLKAPAIDFDSIDPHKPIFDLPDMDRELPDVDLQLPEVDLPEVSVDEGSGLLDAAKAAAMAGGAGLVANAIAADMGSADEATTDHADIADSDADEKNWLLLLVQQAKAVYRGHNHRAVSHLWRSGNTRDCSTLDDFESLSLQPATYDKLGSSHCGVPRAGFVAVGGDVSNIEQGSAVLFHYCNIVVCRDADDTHHFIRVVAD